MKLFPELESYLTPNSSESEKWGAKLETLFSSNFISMTLDQLSTLNLFLMMDSIFNLTPNMNRNMKVTPELTGFCRKTIEEMLMENDESLIALEKHLRSDNYESILHLLNTEAEKLLLEKAANAVPYEHVNYILIRHLLCL